MEPRPSPLARYLLAAYALLIVYGSLYPFTGWRDQGVERSPSCPAPCRATSPPSTSPPICSPTCRSDFSRCWRSAAPRGTAAVAVASAWGGGASASRSRRCRTTCPSRIASNLDLAANAPGELLGALVGADRACARHRAATGTARPPRPDVPARRPTDLGLVLIGSVAGVAAQPGDPVVRQRRPARGAAGPGGRPATRPTCSSAPRPQWQGAMPSHVGLLAPCLVERDQPVRRVAPSLAVIVAAFALRTLAFGMLFKPAGHARRVTPGALFGAAGTGIWLRSRRGDRPRAGRLAVRGPRAHGGDRAREYGAANPYLARALAVWRQGTSPELQRADASGVRIWPFAALVYLHPARRAGARARTHRREASSGADRPRRRPP